MLRKICHCFFGLCMFVGFMFLLGTAGASDCDQITFDQIVKQGVIALVIMLVGFYGFKLTD